MFKILCFEWDAGNMHKPLRHKVSLEEAEQVFWNRPLFKNTREDRYLALGVADNGRYLVVVFTYRAGTARIITARGMKRNERQYYLRQRGE